MRLKKIRPNFRRAQSVGQFRAMDEHLEDHLELFWGLGFIVFRGLGCWVLVLGLNRLKRS